MSRKRQASLNRTLTQLAFDSPYVIATRVSRMLDPAQAFSAAGQSEFLRMFWEKQAATVESCGALMAAGAAQYQRAWLDLWTGALPAGSHASPASVAHTLNSTLQPFQRRASANARRLRGKKSKR
ncbi:hypothetical protein SAMN05428957_108126 [Oryzisolibacter propanilivorax]|uniref:Phasin protein n=1 Tax=Oryzisolibacter propanilivorax TaxID=1527607 RepID=A0A1G9UDN6_9BURK|nr:hypothetical protein [Oryzisolibacter propanilivorax]SDM58036.1 hypothetical protein SAMN05428957_108126 [Oryzisolibacter propanilivorax]